MFDKYIDISPF